MWLHIKILCMFFPFWPTTYHLCTRLSSHPSIFLVNLPFPVRPACRSFPCVCPPLDYIMEKCQKCNLLHHPCLAGSKMAECWEHAPSICFRVVILCHREGVKNPAKHLKCYVCCNIFVEVAAVWFLLCNNSYLKMLYIQKWASGLLITENT